MEDIQENMRQFYKTKNDYLNEYIELRIELKRQLNLLREKMGEMATSDDLARLKHGVMSTYDTLKHLERIILYLKEREQISDEEPSNKQCHIL